MFIIADVYKAGELTHFLSLKKAAYSVILNQNLQHQLHLKKSSLNCCWQTYLTKRTKMSGKGKLCQEKLSALFDKHDFNGDGTIDYKEIKPILKELGFNEAAIEECCLDLVSRIYCCNFL